MGRGNLTRNDCKKLKIEMPWCCILKLGVLGNQIFIRCGLRRGVKGDGKVQQWDQSLPLWASVWWAGLPCLCLICHLAEQEIQGSGITTMFVQNSLGHSSKDLWSWQRDNFWKIGQGQCVLHFVKWKSDWGRDWLRLQGRKAWQKL